MLELVKQAKIGSIFPVYREIDEEIDALEYFAKLSEHGNKKNSLLIEDNEKSFGTANPCLKVAGKDNNFEITPLNALGKKFMNFIKKDFKFCDKAMVSKGKIIGKLTPVRRDVSEQEKFRLKTHLDILRTIAFKLKPADNTFMPFCGLFGMISDNFSNLGRQEEDSGAEDLIKDPDYAFYFVDNMFVADHKAKKTYFVANALIIDKDNEKTYAECSKTISSYEKIIAQKSSKGKKPKKKELKLSYSLGNEEFLGAMKILKRHILEGDILYVTASRTAVSSYNAEPLDIYASLKIAGDNSFYINDGLGVSIGSGAKAALTVKGDGEKIVELDILPPSRMVNAAADAEKDLANKYKALLKVDENEIANSIMIVDAARNDVARVSEPGTRYVDKLLSIDNQSQGIVSSVKGVLNNGMDALHAYAAIFNPPAIDGVPKTKAMQLLSKLGKWKKGFSSGYVLSVTPDKDIYGAAVTPIRIKKDRAYFSINSKVFCNSDNNWEFEKSERNTAKILDVLKSGGIK